MHVVISVRPQRKSTMPINHAQRQKQYRDARERDPAANIRLAAQKSCQKEERFSSQERVGPTSVASLFDNLINRNVRDVDN